MGITCVELKGEDLWSCSHKIESVSLRKCPYDQCFKLTNKAYLSALTVASIFRSFTHKMAAKTGWHIDTERNYVTVTLCTCIQARIVFFRQRKHIITTTVFAVFACSVAINSINGKWQVRSIASSWSVCSVL